MIRTQACDRLPAAYRQRLKSTGEPGAADAAKRHNIIIVIMLVIVMINIMIIIMIIMIIIIIEQT